MLWSSGLSRAWWPFLFLCMGAPGPGPGSIPWALGPAPALGDKVLVLPVDGSHWLSMKLLVRQLALRGHEVLALVPESSMLLQAQGQAQEPFETQSFAVPFTAAQLAENSKWMRENVFYPSPPLAEITTNLGWLLNFTSTQVKGCESLLYNEAVMSRLRARGFQAVLTDPFLPCGSIVADALGLPAVYFLRGMPCGLDILALQCPSPPSYVPRFRSGSSDRMGFLERLNNYVSSGVELQLCKVMYASFDELAARYLQRQVTYRELLGEGALWLMRYDFTFEYPRPVMPNMVFIGGINCVRGEGLSAELQEFVEGSGEHGIVVFTLGSMVASMPKEKAHIFFSAFARIPQRVLWRYSGPLPDHVPDNIKVMKWLPQNDLLGHPKAKAFITHGGTHGIYEGICNGVPMVMLPLFGDQNDNVLRVASRGVGVVLSIFDVTSDALVEALDKVINDSSYQEKMKKLSAIHNDRPMEPLDLAVYWTEFVMRHKGAAHLRPAAHDLNWVQYHSLDVLGFLFIVIATVVLVTIKCCSFCIRKCCGGRLQKPKKD
ncbi:UDP-glucuronosyltransferase-like isoform X2 [Engraulis encrasicolus]|uniref:UDP-glucuronosyltransferase-like isoform X2 n=1 Tax=Engraulis encrasicolus TaxID=184585 RepID=UPI002FD3D8C3